jgi:hypothetical protein
MIRYLPVMADMIYRRFGRTGLQMPVLSTGGMRYQDGWKDKPIGEIGQENQRNLEACIHRSVELGINHIETARGYGPSERQLGRVLPTLPREKLIVQTKIGPKEEADAFLADFEDSLARLQLDHVDLLAIHGINDQASLHHSIKPGGCLAAARKLQHQGKARHIGFSTHGPADVLLQAVDHDADGGFDYINLHWYFIFRRNWPVIEAATARDMGVFIISPTDKGGHLHTPSPKLVELSQPLHPITFNDLWCLNHPQVHTLSVGVAKPQDYDEHLEAVRLLPEADRLLPPIVRHWEQAMTDAVGHASPEFCTPGLPAHEQTPGGLNLENILWLRNLALGWDLHRYAKSRFNLMGNGGSWFAGAKVDAAFAEVDKDALAAAVQDHPCGDRILDMVAQTIELLGGEDVKRVSQA